MGTNSFGVEVFNGATVSLTGGGITTSGTNAARVRAYAGDGNILPGQATVDGTTITNSGKGDIGVIAGELAGSSGTERIDHQSQAQIVNSRNRTNSQPANHRGSKTTIMSNQPQPDP